VRIFSALGKISLYFLVASGIGILLFERMVRLAMRLQANQALLGIALGILLIYANSAHSAGMASVTGAYLAGLFLGRTSVRRRLLSGMDTIGHTLFISVFFVNVGLQAELGAVGRMYPFFVLYVLVAILSKFLGSGLGALCGGLEFRRSIRVGVGMVPRGEVALAVTSVAVSKGLMGGPEFSSIVLLVLVTALMTAPLLKWSFASGIRLKESREGNDVSARNHTE
jgi:Kef-type K+ transport system membrane component KefB